MSYQTVAIINFPGCGRSPWRRRHMPLSVRVGLAVVGGAMVLCSVLLALAGGSRPVHRTGTANFKTVRAHCQKRTELFRSLRGRGN